jgi:hypothetical protein
MKVIYDNCVYVQKNDIAYLEASDLPIPASVFTRVFGNGITIIDDRNRYDFVLFKEKAEIDFFKGLDWMVDYNELKNLSEEEIIKLAENTNKERDEIVLTYNSMPVEERQKHGDMVTKCDLLEFKFYSLRDILWMKQGHISINIPKMRIRKPSNKKD